MKEMSGAKVSGGNIVALDALTDASLPVMTLTGSAEPVVIIPSR